MSRRVRERGQKRKRKNGRRSGDETDLPVKGGGGGEDEKGKGMMLTSPVAPSVGLQTSADRQTDSCCPSPPPLTRVRVLRPPSHHLQAPSSCIHRLFTLRKGHTEAAENPKERQEVIDPGGGGGFMTNTPRHSTVAGTKNQQGAPGTPPAHSPWPGFQGASDVIVYLAKLDGCPASYIPRPAIKHRRYSP